MAYGNELILGLTVDRFNEIEGLRVDAQKGRLIRQEAVECINMELKRAHLKLLRKYFRMAPGLTSVGDLRTTGRLDLNDLYLHANTPLGMRQFSAMRLELFLDDLEMGETINEAVVGVAISSRYFPTFADWKDPNGTLYPIVFNAEMATMQKMARKAIASVIPWLKTADWIVKEQHY